MEPNPDDGFSQYVKDVRSDLRRRAFLLCGDWFEADDLTQKTLVKVFLQWPHLDNRGTLTGFTRTVMIRIYISDRRAARWSREILVAHHPEPEAVERDHFDDRLLLLSALDRLGHRQRAVIVLRYWEHLTVRETADALGCSPGTVRSQASRALSTLRTVLQRDPLPEDPGDQDPPQKRHKP
ncbi:SigE family RNA polymerase sigma factor [Actinomadura sp. KC216]|uniref:SigE family RNA polymerase sigma factor n=1 Tax=Actinomadura sp. KC216 TaxID=2530370 RepID=UPI00104FB983|nr:SigE family RNA polymerase sigma factor [Actinomadura sp. KC216]TDB81361.1 SigE family RNA polymerase sigma factor [Actinomadura sp. KC216]